MNARDLFGLTHSEAVTSPEYHQKHLELNAKWLVEGVTNVVEMRKAKGEHPVQIWNQAACQKVADTTKETMARLTPEQRVANAKRANRFRKVVPRVKVVCSYCDVEMDWPPSRAKQPRSFGRFCSYEHFWAYRRRSYE
jgi:hypothetical protein